MTTSHTSQRAVMTCTSTLKKLVSVKGTKICSVIRNLLQGYSSVFFNSCVTLASPGSLTINVFTPHGEAQPTKAMGASQSEAEWGC